MTARLQCGDKAAEGAQSVTVEMVGTADTAIITSELPVVRDEALGCHQLRLPENRGAMQRARTIRRSIWTGVIAGDSACAMRAMLRRWRA